MGWSIGFDSNWNRDIGYGVVAYCDHPKCKSVIDRGISYVCGGEPYGGEHGCGLYFCSKHLWFKDLEDNECFQACSQCYDGKEAYKPKPEHPRWIGWKMKDPSWAEWRKDNAR